MAIGTPHRARRVAASSLKDPPALAGLVPALLVACVSLTPSLMPRSAGYQGVVTGVAAALAYGAGVAVARLVRPRLGQRVPRRVTASAGLVALVGAVVLLGFLLWRWRGWQADLHALVGSPAPAAWAPLVIVVVAAAVLFVLVAVGRLLRDAGRRLGAPLRLVLPAALATFAGVVLVMVVLVAATDRWVTERVLGAIDSSFDSANNDTPSGAEQPETALRSGGPGSLSPWDELGSQGRAFVGKGPTAQDLSDAAGRPAAEPIRVYGGLDTTEDLNDLAELVVAELERTGGFERAVLCVAVPTGRGWVNPDAAGALEQLYAGDTAIASMQYSYLPSPLAFLVDPERAKDTGRALFDAVHDRWLELPPAERPTLVVYGESLGSTGAQAAFSGLADLRDRADGALFVGPPESNTLWRDLVERRDPGSTEARPVYDAGTTVRFAATPSDLDRPTGEWGDSRLLFLQNPTDPIVWWSSDLAWQRPDWLSESTEELSGPIRWFPVVTFLQVSADMAVANNAPAGLGHRYGDFVDYWAAIAPPAGWTPADTARLAGALDGQ